MSPTYQQNKVHIYKWVANNREKVRAINYKSCRKRCEWLKIQRIFLKILL